MRAITLTEPWATLVAIGKKGIETRSWWTSYRGPLAIHAAKLMPSWAKALRLHEPFRTALTGSTGRPGELPLWPGCVVATCDLVACERIGYTKAFVCVDDSYWGIKRVWLPPDEPELSFGDYTPGRWAWILANVRRLPEPIPATGALGLWRWTPPAELQLEETPS